MYHDRTAWQCAFFVGKKYGCKGYPQRNAAHTLSLYLSTTAPYIPSTESGNNLNGCSKFMKWVSTVAYNVGTSHKQPDTRQTAYFWWWQNMNCLPAGGSAMSSNYIMGRFWPILRHFLLKINYWMIFELKKNEFLIFRLFTLFFEIPLIQHPQDWIDAILSNILDYETVPVCTDLCSHR
jgi:hypothetical protein